MANPTAVGMAVPADVVVGIGTVGGLLVAVLTDPLDEGERLAGWELEPTTDDGFGGKRLGAGGRGGGGRGAVRAASAMAAPASTRP